MNFEKHQSMNKSVSILDKEYKEWVKDLAMRYRNSQIKAAVKVNTEMLKFYWELGKDIVELHAEKRWGDKVMNRLSIDLREAMPGVSGLTQRNIYYCKQFYLLYSPALETLPQAGAKSSEEKLPQPVARFQSDIFSVPWGHHKILIGWSRAMLLNFIGTGMYERQGIPPASGRNGKLHRPAFLQPQPVVLCRDRGKDRKVQLQ